MHRQLRSADEAGVSLSLFQAGPGGRYQARYQIDYRHRFSHIPSFFAPSAHGGISGYVFRDDSGNGQFRPGMRGIESAEVVLDGEQRTRTDDRGFYLFKHVAAGPHRVEVIPHMTGAFYFTTPSSSSAEINSQVNFGIAYASGHVFGAVLSDAGEPIPGVIVHLTGANQELTLQSGDNGQFDRGGVVAGAYTASVDPDSVPPGYWLAGLKKERFTVESDIPAKLEFQLKAMRAIVGRVVAYDAVKGREVPAGDVVVTIIELHSSIIADTRGVFHFKDLPAGTYTVSVVYKGREFKETVVMPGGPLLVSDLTIKVGAK